MSIFKRNPNEVNYAGGSKHFLDVIKNTGDGNLLIWRQPEEDFNTNSVLIVNPGEEAIFIKNGEIVNVFSSGRYELTTENYPFLSRIRNVLSGGISTFNCIVYFIRKAHSMEILWGTDYPIQLRDPIQQIATSVKSRGSYKIQIDDSSIFLTKLLGNNIQYLEQDSIREYFNNQFQQKIKSSLSKALKESKEEILGICSEMELFAEQITPSIESIFGEYGIKLVNFCISAMEIPEDDPNRMYLEQAYAKKREVDIMGEKYQTIKGLDILENISNNPSGIAGAGVGLGMGMAAGSLMGDVARSAFAPIEHEQVPQTASGQGEKSYMEKLADLKKMLEMGLIEQAEYDMLKKEILQKIMQ